MKRSGIWDLVNNVLPGRIVLHELYHRQIYEIHWVVEGQSKDHVSCLLLLDR